MAPKIAECLSCLLILSSVVGISHAQGSSTSAYTAPAGFPTALFSDYYIQPSSNQQPQPILKDPVSNYVYPFSLTDSKQIPNNTGNPEYYPDPTAQYTNGTAIVTAAYNQIVSIINDKTMKNCTKCIQALQIGKYVAQRVPQLLPDAMIMLCRKFQFHGSIVCRQDFGSDTFGPIWAQILALGDMAGSDGLYVCNHLSSTFCPAPHTLASDTSALFPKPKPANAQAPPPSGKRVKVLHMSDFHLDPRYDTGGEAECTGGLCCRSNKQGADVNKISKPASLYGSLRCDAPYFLAVSALDSVTSLTGTSLAANAADDQTFAWSIFTGDIVPHDGPNQISRDFVQYAEYALFYMLQKYIPGGPIFSVLGNHDSTPEAIDSPHSLPGPLGQQFSWNYDHVSSLWQLNGWLSSTAAAQARMHYAGYSINHPNYPKLRIISLNTDFWYINNLLNYINTTNPDNSGQLAFLVQELQNAEDAGERVWIIGHVLTGWDGANPLPNPTDLFYQIVDRYSPHVIANIFFGHTHEDQVMIYYSNNGTNQVAANAQTVGWIGPSITPYTNLNSGYRMYMVDTGDFSVYDAYTYYSDVSTYSSIDVTSGGPVYELEYSTRDTYSIGWPSDAPLNATYWHHVTEEMLVNHTLVNTFNTYQSKSSVVSSDCTSDACAKAKVCYIRSGSTALGRQCPKGFSGVQSGG